MSKTLTRRPALLVAACILVSAVTGMLLGQVTISDAAPGTDPRPVTEPITPCRILETRNTPGTNGPTGAPAAPIGAGQTLTLQVAGATGQGTPNCTIATGLVGAVLNITAINATGDTFLTVYPCNATRPNASTLNPFPGRIVFNAATVTLSPTGTVCIFNNVGTVDVVADVTAIQYNHNHNDSYYTETEINALNARTLWVTVGLEGVNPPQVFRGGIGVTGVTRLTTGLYTVSFNRDVDLCGWVATINDEAGGVVPTGFIGVELQGNGIADRNDLTVRLRDLAGSLTDFSTTDAFTLQVICP